MSKRILSLVLIAFFTFATNAFAMLPEKEDAYVLSVGQKGSRRLDLQNDLLKEYTDEHLKKADLSKGQIAWDIGCGNGTMTVKLARKVGETGTVYALDISEEQLTIAKERVKDEGLKNVTFIQGDIMSQKDLPTGSVDLVYMRFFLSHLKDPEVAIGIAKDLLKPGGVVASQEATMSTFYDSSNHQIFCEYRNAVAAMGKKFGKDFDLGLRLQSLYEQAGYAKTDGYFIQPTMNLAVTRELFLLDIGEWTPKAIDAGILTPDQIENWRHTINHWADEDENFTMAKYGYVLAWKEKR